LLSDFAIWDEKLISRQLYARFVSIAKAKLNNRE
jgi:hypothetical protein